VRAIGYIKNALRALALEPKESQEVSRDSCKSAFRAVRYSTGNCGDNIPTLLAEIPDEYKPLAALGMRV
jgi:hypothetical protein